MPFSGRFPFPSLDLPKACAEDVLKLDAADPEAEIEAQAIRECCDSYFAQFVPGPDCPMCGRRLTGVAGSFVWGLHYGEGKCVNCNWPCRARHNPKRGGNPIFASDLPVVLAYHPVHVVATRPADPPAEPSGVP